MGSFTNSQPNFVKRIVAAGAAAVGVITLIGIGSQFKIVGNTAAGQKSGGSGSVLQVWASSGAQVGKLNSSGSLVLSGALILGQRKTGTGYLLCKGSRGCMQCATDSDGAGGCTCCYWSKGAQVCRVGITAECSQPDAI